MVTDESRMEAGCDDPYILLTCEKITTAGELMPLLDKIMRAPRPLVIMAEAVEGSALGMLVSNHIHGNLRSVAVRAPGFGHRRIAELQDVAAFTNGRVVTQDAGLTMENVLAADLGRARRVLLTRDGPTLPHCARQRQPFDNPTHHA